MKTITLHIGDKLVSLKDRPFGAYVGNGEVVTVVGFNRGNSYKDDGRSCPAVKANDGWVWYTDLKKLFHNYKKVGK